jgi:hypothetical protein
MLTCWLQTGQCALFAEGARSIKQLKKRDKKEKQELLFRKMLFIKNPSLKLTKTKFIYFYFQWILA